MRRPGRELIDRLAAEYVLGTLRGAARARFSRWLTTPSEPAHSEVRQAVRQWEDRLVHLSDRVQPVAPSPRVWREIVRRTRMPDQQRMAPWTGWALAASLVLMISGVWFYSSSGRDDARWQVAAEFRDVARQQAWWRVDFDANAVALRVTAAQPPLVAADAVHELWALPASGAAPVSLGLLPQSGDRLYKLSATQRAAFAAAGQLAVSREPTGGSPTGAPTGPVILVVPRAQVKLAS